MKYKLYILLAFLFVGFSACEDSLDELNFDPTKLTEVELRLMLPDAIVQGMHNEGGNHNRIAGIVMQQFEGIDAQQIQYTNYQLGEDVVNNYWNFGLYSGVLRSCQVIIDQATEQGDATFYSGVARIIMANQYGIATSMFGDIPFTEALKGQENLTPVYDSQESVYSGIQTLLDEGIRDLQDGAGYGGGDLIFDGDAAKWIATARALKARYLLHTSKRTGNYSAILNELGSAFASQADQPQFTFETSETANWALAKFGIERPSTLGISGNFVDMMNGDPRQPNYMEDLGGPVWDFYNGTNADLVWAQNTSTVPMISFVEVQFIRAEALAQSGAATGDVEAALADAITASMELVGVADAGTYVADNSSLTGLTSDQIIEKVVTEAYKAYYGFAFHETWANYRRTGYPVLTPSALGSNGLNPSGVVPRRLLYVESESQTNGTNKDDAADRIGGNFLDNDIWAFQ